MTINRIISEAVNKLGVRGPIVPAKDSISAARGKKAVNELDQFIDLIESNGSFDLELYNRKAESSFKLREAIAHYLANSAVNKLPPNQTFDADFYLKTNQDVATSGTHPFVHYLAFGQDEGRYPNSVWLAKDVETIYRSNIFDAKYYMRHIPEGPDMGMLELIKHYLTTGWRNLRPNDSFDADFFRQAYPDSTEEKKNPIFYFLKHRFERHFITCHDQIGFIYKVIAESTLFDENFYRNKYTLPEQKYPDAVIHYIVEGAKNWFDPSSSFSTEYYSRRHPDVSKSAVNPLAHYLISGKAEGRAISPDWKQLFSSAQREIDPHKATVLVALHECSPTGAPLLGLSLIRSLSQDFNLVIWTARGGDILPELESCASYIRTDHSSIVDDEFALKSLIADVPIIGAVANSVETFWLLPALKACGIPSVSLLHEYADYTLPAGKIGQFLLDSDRCVAPASNILDSAQAELKKYWSVPPINNTVLQPQGLLPKPEIATTLSTMPGALQLTLKGKKLVVGVGHVQIRKGVDLFLEVAHFVREKTGNNDIHFVWVGGGFAPKSDVGYSVWLQSAIERRKLEDCTTILPAQSSLDWVFEAADIFLLSSRLDPFPNVVVDAMAAGLPIVCFDQATGCAEFLKDNEADARVVPYLDTRAAADAVLELIDRPNFRTTVNRTIVDSKLRFSDYVEAIKRQLQIAQDFCVERKVQCELIAASESFNKDFFDPKWKSVPDPAGAILEYVNWEMKGAAILNPCPGFNTLRYRATKMGTEPVGEAPLAHAWKSGGLAALKTHECVVFDPLTTVTEGCSPLKVALHLHLFYTDLCLEFVEQLESSAIQADLFISCPDQAAKEEIEIYLKAYERGRVIVRAVPNLGRDIGPLITEFSREIIGENYDLIGHLHAKESKALGSNTPGPAWRKYLWQSLLGDGTWSHIQAEFSRDQELGLIFAEDRHALGWSANYVIANELRDRLGLTQELPITPIFPVGTMFWSRPAAINKLLQLPLQWKDYPEEPLAYDGTILHALERLLPTICEDAGFRWSTIYCAGTNW